MVTVGVVAALGMRHAEKRWAGGFATFARRAPYASGALISIVGVVLAFVLIGFVILPVLGVLWLVFVVIATMRASEGRLYRYPLTIRFVS